MVFITVIGLVIFLVTLDVNQYKPAIIAKVSEQTGREFNIEGDLEVVPSLSPAIAVLGITLGNAPWGDSDSMVEIGRIEARVSIIPLLSGEIKINDFILHDTRIALEKEAERGGNWVLTANETDTNTTSTPDQGSALPPISVENIEIRDVLLSYRDHETDSVIEFRLDEFTTAITDRETPVSFTLRADYNNNDMALSGQVGSIDGLLSGDEFPLDISGNLGELVLGLNGNLADLTGSPSGSIALTFEIDTLSDLNTFTGGELPDLGPLTFSGILNFADTDTLNLDNISLQLAEIGITGNLITNMAGDVSSITARLQSDVLDLSPFMLEETEEEVEFLFPRDTLPLASLASVNADFLYNVKMIVTPSIELANNELTISLTNGNIRVSNGASIAGGMLSVSLSLDSVNENQARLSADINGDGIMLEMLPHEEDRWFTGGATTIAINGTGSGGSIAEIMGAYSGNILIKVGEAQMPNSGIDMFGADIILSTFNKLNPLSSQEDYSLLECAVINLPVDDGLITLDRQIAVQTSKMYMVGSGEINLKDETLNLGVRPYAKEGVGLNLSSVAGAAKIGGTLANPTPVIDAENAIRTGLSAGAAVATGGLSLLAQGLFSKSGADPEPCNTALGIVSQTSTETSTTQESAETSDDGNVVDDVKNTLKGLFGR